MGAVQLRVSRVRISSLSCIVATAAHLGCGEHTQPAAAPAPRSGPAAASSCWGPAGEACVVQPVHELLDSGAGLPELLAAARQLRRACQDAAQGQAAWLVRRAEGDDEAAEWTGVHAELAQAHCRDYRDLTEGLAGGELRERFAAIHSDDQRLASAAGYVAHLLAAAAPAGLDGHLLHHGVLRQVDPIDDHDIAAYVRCWVDAPDRPDCRDIHLHRLGAVAHHLPETQAHWLATHLVGAIEATGEVLDEADRARLRRAIAPIVLVTCDAAKLDAPDAPCLRWLSDNADEVTATGPGLSPLHDEICLYSAGANHLQCFRPDEACGSADAVLDSFSGDNELLGSGSCAYAKMLMYGCGTGLGAPLCKSEACGSETDAGLPDLVAQRLGEQEHAQLCDSLPDGNSGPDLTRFFPFDGLDCAFNQTGFNARACGDAVGEASDAVGELDVSQSIEAFSDGCAGGQIESHGPVKEANDIFELGLAVTEATEYWADEDNRIDFENDVVIRHPDDAENATFAHSDRDQAVRDAEFVEFTKDAKILDHLEADLKNAGSMTQAEKDAAVQKAAKKAKAWTNPTTGEIKINSDWRGKWTVTNLTDVLKHEYPHNLTRDEHGKPALSEQQEHESACGADVDTTSCEQAGMKNGSSGTGTGTPYCAADGDCSDECSAAAQAAKAQFSACADDGIQIDEPGSVDPWILPDPRTWSEGTACSQPPDPVALSDQCLAMMCPADSIPAACEDSTGTCCCRRDGGGEGTPGLDTCDQTLNCGPYGSPAQGEYGCTCSGPLPDVDVGTPQEPTAPDHLALKLVRELAANTTSRLTEPLFEG